MLIFENVAQPYTREELLKAGGLYKKNNVQREIHQSLANFANHMVSNRSYGFLEPKRVVQPEVEKGANNSVLSKPRLEGGL